MGDDKEDEEASSKPSSKETTQPEKDTTQPEKEDTADTAKSSEYGDICLSI